MGVVIDLVEQIWVDYLLPTVQPLWNSQNVLRGAVLVLVTLLIAIVACRKKIVAAFSRDKTIEHDKEIAASILKALPHNGSVGFLADEFDGMLPFHFSSLAHLCTFENEFNHAGNEFLLPELDKKRKELAAAVSLFLRRAGEFTYPNNACRMT